jgi:hypothetical protein
VSTISPASVSHPAYYFNIADAVSLRAEEFVWRDLDVDILVGPKGTVHVLDEHELPSDLPSDLARYIEDARDHILAHFRDIIREADALLAMGHGEARHDHELTNDANQSKHPDEDQCG